MVSGLQAQASHSFRVGFAVGVLSREKLHSAVDAGVPVSRIRDFLEQNLHEEVKRRNDGPGGAPLLPPNVLAQLEQWERERSGTTIRPACMIALDAAPENVAG